MVPWCSRCPCSPWIACDHDRDQERLQLLHHELPTKNVYLLTSSSGEFCMDANLVFLLYLGSPFTWDKVFKVFILLPNHVKNQRLFVHILYNILFNCMCKVAHSYVAVVVGKPL